MGRAKTVLGFERSFLDEIRYNSEGGKVIIRYFPQENYNGLRVELYDDSVTRTYEVSIGDTKISDKKVVPFSTFHIANFSCISNSNLVLSKLKECKRERLPIEELESELEMFFEEQSEKEQYLSLVT